MELVVENWMKTRNANHAKQGKRMYYLSAEFLMGRALSNNLINTGLMAGVKDVLDEMGIPLFQNHMMHGQPASA